MNEYRVLVECWKGKTKIPKEKFAQLCLPQIPHGVACKWNQAFALRLATNRLSHSKTLTLQNTMSTCQCEQHSRLWKAATSSHDQIDVIPHIVFINIRETYCSIFRIQDSEIGIWADNVGWVGEMDHKDGRLASCSRMGKDPNIRCRAEESE